MKQSNLKLPLTVALMGAAAFFLRFCLYVFGTDEKGLLVSGHPLEMILWLLTAAAAVLVLTRTRKLGGKRRYADHFPASAIAAAGCVLFAAGILLSIMAEWNTYTTLERLRNILGLLAVLALVFVAVCRWKGTVPFFAFHLVICLFLTLYTITHYPIWSSRPQLQDSFFPMMGCILLMLVSYYQTAFDVQMGNRRMQLATGLLSGFACFAAIPGSAGPLLYATGGIWALTNLCSLTPSVETQKEDTP